MEAEAGREGASLERFESGAGIDGDLEDRIGILVGDGLDLDAAFGAGDQRVDAATAVERHRDVVLLLDVDAGGDEKSIHLDAFRAGLDRHHSIAQHEGGGVAGLVHRAHELDESGLAATTGVYLGLHHHERLARGEQLLGLGDRILHGLDHAAGGNGDAGVGEELSGLVLVDLHGGLGRG